MLQLVTVAAGLLPGAAHRRPARPAQLARASRPAMAESLTERLMSTLPTEEQTGGAGGQSTYESLLGFNAAWEKLKKGEVARPRQIVSPGATPTKADYDLVVVGGNLGILLATALAVRGLKVAVVEAGALRGRNQDWNASRKEVLELVRAYSARRRRSRSSASSSTPCAAASQAARTCG